MHIKSTSVNVVNNVNCIYRVSTKVYKFHNGYFFIKDFKPLVDTLRGVFSKT